jgi:hypothetical protein
MRCGAAMEWRHGTWQCPRCRFKIGCCEGDTGECAAPPAPAAYASVVSAESTGSVSGAA